MRVVVIGSALAVLGAGAGFHPGQADVIRSGLARAQLAKVVPYIGIPGVGAGVGVAQAQVDGSGSRASAGMADFGAMAMILGAVGGKAPVAVPELPAPITADSRGPADVERNPIDATAVPAHEEAHAKADPASQARVRGPELSVPDVFALTAGESRAEATATFTGSTVTLGRLVLGGGAAPQVVLENLVWSARQDLGRPGAANFTIGSATVAGQALPTAGAGSTDAVLKTVNDALVPVGLHLDAPAAAGDPSGATVSSLVLQVRNPETTAGLLGQAAQPVTPTLNRVLDTLLAAAPDAAGARLVVNALLATGTGRGGGRLELGGASARLGVVEVVAPAAPEPPPLPDVTIPAPEPVSPVPAAAPVTDPAPVALPYPTAGFDAPAPTFEPPPAPITPPGAARSPIAPAAPDGRQLAALPARAAGPPGGPPAPLVLGAALVAILILALSDKLRLRQAGGAGVSPVESGTGL